MNELMNKSVKKKGESKRVLPPAAPHGNTKYDFDQLKKVGDFFILDDPKEGRSIFTCLRNYNEKHNTDIKVSTKNTVAGMVVQRIRKS